MYQINIERNYFLQYVFTLTHALQRKSHLCILRKGIARPQSHLPHSCVCERLYSQDRSTYFPAAKYINRSRTHEYGNWDFGCIIPFSGIFVSNIRCCVFAVWKHLNSKLDVPHRLELSRTFCYGVIAYRDLFKGKSKQS